MEVPTETDVAGVATEIYQKDVLGSNLAGKAEETALEVENFCRKVATAQQLIVSCSRVASWVHQLIAWGKRECHQRLDTVQTHLESQSAVTGWEGGSGTDQLVVSERHSGFSLQGALFFQDLRVEFEKNAEIIARLQEVLQTGTSRLALFKTSTVQASLTFARRANLPTCGNI